MTRHTILNEETGRRVFKTGVLGRKIQSKIEKKKKKMKGTKDKKVNKKTIFMMFHSYASMVSSAQKLLDAGFEEGQIIAICSFDGKKRKVLSCNASGCGYWSSKKAQ